MITDEASLAEVIAAFAAGSGPVAVDAERASGYRYGQRAYLVQLRREGAGSALIDPVACPDLSGLGEAVSGAEWVLHAATQDLPCLRGIGMIPTTLFDTELAGRLAGFPRVGLGAMVESVLGFVLEKGHSAVDWSTRPLPEPWLRYAALDVELLVDLRDALEKELDRQGKLEWARQEFDAIAQAEPAPPRKDPWRRTSGMHKVRRRRQMAVVRELWETRDRVAQRRDISPGKVLGDAAIVEAALAVPANLHALAALNGFGHRMGLAPAGAVAGRGRPREGAAGRRAAPARPAGDRASPAAGLGRQGPGRRRPALRRAGRRVGAGRAAEHAAGEPHHPGHRAARVLGAAQDTGHGVGGRGAHRLRGPALAGGAGHAGTGDGAVREDRLGRPDPRDAWGPPGEALRGRPGSGTAPECLSAAAVSPARRRARRTGRALGISAHPAYGHPFGVGPRWPQNRAGRAAVCVVRRLYAGGAPDVRRALRLLRMPEALRAPGMSVVPHRVRRPGRVPALPVHAGRVLEGESTRRTGDEITPRSWGVRVRPFPGCPTLVKRRDGRPDGRGGTVRREDRRGRTPGGGPV